MRAKDTCAAMAAGALLCALGALAADGYPVQPVRLVVTGPAGAGIDLDSRAVAQKMSELLGRQIVVDNRGAASGIAGMEIAAKAKGDGYTLVTAGLGPLVAFPSLYRKLPYDLARDFAPVSLLEVLPVVLSVHPSLSVSSVRELIAAAKARPGEITFASQGNGTFVHLAAELFKNVTGTDLRHVPYGAQSPFVDLAGGHVAMMFSGIAPVLGNIKAGRLKALAVSASRRVAILAEVPTFAEAGVPAYQANAWVGMLAPRGTPQPIIERLHSVAARAVSAPEVRERMIGFGGVPMGGTPAEFAQYIKAEQAKWSKVIHDADVRIE